MHQVRTMCRMLGVSPSGYYAWRGREPSARSKADEELKARIGASHERSRGTYGVSRVHAEIEAQGERLGAKRVARLMRALGLEGVSRRRCTHTTIRRPDTRPAPDLVERDFSADAPDRLWVADITYGVSSSWRRLGRRCRGSSMFGMHWDFPRKKEIAMSAIRYGIARAEAAVTFCTLEG